MYERLEVVAKECEEALQTYVSACFSTRIKFGSLYRSCNAMGRKP